MARIQASPSSTGTPRGPAPPPRDQVEADFDFLAQSYDATLGRAKSPRLVSLVISLQPPRTARFLDIGCGGGRLVARMAEFFAEVAVCSNVLHHLDPAATLREILRVLRPGDRLLVVDDIVPTDPAGRRQEPRRWFDPRRWPREIALLLNLMRRFGLQDANPRVPVPEKRCVAAPHGPRSAAEPGRVYVGLESSVAGIRDQAKPAVGGLRGVGQARVGEIDRAGGAFFVDRTGRIVRKFPGAVIDPRKWSKAVEDAFAP